MLHALIWLVAIEAVGLLALPLSYRLFSRLPGGGVVFSKALGLLLVTYGVWVLGLTHLIPNSRFTVIAFMLLVGVFSALVMRRRWGEFVEFLRRERLGILAAEAVFLLLFVLWVAIVSRTPEINHTEKPMDLAFLSSIMRSRFFPPEDPWLAGHPISYYYMGHMMMAMLGKLTGISSSIAYNLAISLIPALTGAIAYGLVYDLIRVSGGSRVRAALYALFAPVLIGLIGNLEGALEFAYLRGWGSSGFWEWASIKGLHPVQHGAQSGVFPGQQWWWWRASRVVDTLDYSTNPLDPRSLDYTINEFPFFSFILGDMHPHMLSLPFFLIGVGVVLNVFLTPARVGLGWLRSHPWQGLAIALIVGSLGFINVIDLPVIAALLAAGVLAKAHTERQGLLHAVWATALMLLPVFTLALVLYIPFYRTLNSQVSWPLPILPVEHLATQPLHYIVVWGFLAFLSLSYLAMQMLAPQPAESPGRRWKVLVGLVALGPFLLWALVRIVLGVFDDGPVESLLAVGNRFARILPLAAIAGAGMYLAASRARADESRGHAFVLLLLAAAFYLIMGVELFRLNDLFGNRMNTVFKLYYQAWVFLALVGACALYAWLSRPVSKRFVGRLAETAWVLAAGLLLVCSLYYSSGAVLDKTGGFKGPATLDGMAFLGQGSGEYEAIRWLRDDAPYGRIVEAVGDSYSEHGRISAATGLPTVIGWEWHEYQWRGSDQLFRSRKDEVAQVYQSGDAATVLAVLDKYDVRYVVVGPRERTKYGREGLQTLDGLLERAFSRGDVIIYERLP